MQFIRALAVGIAVLTAGTASASCPGSCAIPGGGAPKLDCYVEYAGPTLNYPVAKPREVRCVDGDPTCDGDGSANGSCRFAVSACVNNVDPRFPTCAPSTVTTYTIRNGAVGSKKYNPELAALEAATSALLPTATPQCTAPRTQTVPLRVRAAKFQKNRLRIASLALTTAALRDADSVSLTCLPSPIFPTPGTTYARAGVIANASELIDGPLSRGRLGDFRLANDKIQLVIQQPGRSMFGIGIYGGNIIDADLQRVTGDERDNFEEFAPGINLENTAHYTNVTVLNDGTNGQPAKIRATGPDDLLDFINPSSVVRNFVNPLPASIQAADDTDLPIDVQTDYTLDPGKNYVKVETTIANQSASTLQFFFAEYLNGSGQLELFIPQNGFGEPLLTTACKPASFKPCPAGTCDVCPMAAYSGFGLGAGVSYGYVAPYNGSSLFNTSGVSVMLYGRDAIFALGGVAGPNFSVQPAGNPNDHLTLTRYFVVGDGTVASIEDARNQILGIATGTLAGTVTSNGQPVADADVTVTGPPASGGPTTSVIDHFRTAADGSYSGTLPPGSYTVLANKDGRLAPTPASAPVTINASQMTTQNFTFPGPGLLRVTVKDESNNALPAKVQLVGFDPSPDPLNGQSILAGLVVTTTGVFGDLENDLQHGVAQVFFTGASGDTGVVDMEPGTYEVVVSRGPRYSAFTQMVTIAEGATTTVNAQIAKVVPTPGFISGDFHIHGINSPDCAVSLPERVVTEAAEGMDFMVPSDHDIRVDYAPTIAALGLSSQISTALNAEITTFDYGHFNSWPVTLDPSQVNGGSVDHGRAGVPAGFDFPAYGSYSLTPDEIFAAAHADPKANLVQINHMRSHFNTDGLDIDTAMTPPQSHTPGAFRRLDPSVPNYFSPNFDALEVWIGTDGRTGELGHFLGENIGDWFNMLNQGILRSGVADSDTHNQRTTDIDARNYVASAVTNPGALGPQAETLAGNVVAGHSFGTNGPFIQVTTSAPSTGQTGGLALGLPTMIATTNGAVDVTVSVKSPLWAEFDRIEFYVNNAPQAYDHDGDPNTRDRYRVIPNVVHAAGTDFTVSTITDYPSIPGAQHFEATDTLHLTGLAQDSWVVVLVRGTDGVSHPLFPVLPNSLKKSGNATLADLLDGNLNENGELTLAFSNPLYVDANNDAVWTPPGVMLTP